MYMSEDKFILLCIRILNWPKQHSYIWPHATPTEHPSGFLLVAVDGIFWKFIWRHNGALVFLLGLRWSQIWTVWWEGGRAKAWGHERTWEGAVGIWRKRKGERSPAQSLEAPLFCAPTTGVPLFPPFSLYGWILLEPGPSSTSVI